MTDSASPDWVNVYLAHTEGHPTPPIFRLWSAISCLGAAMERRCFVDTSKGYLFANEYILLVAPPGVGKNRAIEPMEQVLRAANTASTPATKFVVAARSVNRASLIDNLRAGYKSIPVADRSAIVEYHSLYAINSEMSILLPEFNLDYLGVLNEIYSNPPNYSERRRGHSRTEELEVILPQLNILAGAQPAYLSEIMSDNSWKMGMASRVIMVYAGTAPDSALFDNLQDDDMEFLIREKLPETLEFRFLVSTLKRIAATMGRFRWTAEAKRELQRWVSAKCPPTPTHSKLEAYLERRPAHLLKLTMAASISRSLELQIELCDVERARKWMLEAETLMPNIFTSMTQKSDAALINETFEFAFKMYAPQRKNVPDELLLEFLHWRTTVEKAERILDAMDKMGILVRVVGSAPASRRPKPRDVRGDI